MPVATGSKRRIHFPGDLDEQARALVEALGMRAPELHAQVEVRSEAAEGPCEFAGYAVKWDEPTLIRDWWFGDFFEVFHRGSWAETIAERGPSGNKQIKLCYKHDRGYASFGGGPLAATITALFEDDLGVRYEATTIDTTTGRDLAAELRAGVVDRMSFTFEPLVERIDKETDPHTHHVEKIRAYELSPVNWPAYEGSVIDSVRGEGDGAGIVQQLRDVLAAVRDGKSVPEAARRTINEANALMREIVDAVHTTASSAGAEDGLDDRERALQDIEATELEMRGIRH